MKLAKTLLLCLTFSSAVFAADQKELNEMLQQAVIAGNADKIYQLLDQGAEVDASGKFGKTALMRAAEIGKTDAIAALLSHGADVNARTRSGSTALTFAAENGHEDITAMLVELGANVHDRTRAGWNALMIASREGYDLIAAQLLEFGADVRASDRKGNSALMYAIKEGHASVVKTLFKYSDLVAPCVPNDAGVTPLMAAIEHQKPDLIDILLPIMKQQNIQDNVNFRDNDGATALHVAVDLGNMEVAERLLTEVDAKVNIQDIDGATPLILAVEAGNTELANLLLAHGADAAIKNADGKSAKELADAKGLKLNGLSQ